MAGCAAGCGDAGADLVDREALVGTFEASGERVTLQFDFAKEPGSPIDVTYEVSGGSLTDKGFGLVLLDDHDAALDHAVGIIAISHGQLEVVRHKNVVLVASAKMKPARRARLVALLESL